MRSSLLGCIGGALGVGVGLAGGGCVAGVAPNTGDGGTEGGIEIGIDFGDGGAGDDAATSDGGGMTDGATADSGLACAQLGGAYDNAKACASVADCTTVARGCYCGAQPILGIATSFASAAQACETKSASMCGLGCANFPGHTAEDGKNDVDGGTIEVRCDLGKCHTVLP